VETVRRATPRKMTNVMNVMKTMKLIINAGINVMIMMIKIRKL
jgi:hypothetical protein